MKSRSRLVRFFFFSSTAIILFLILGFGLFWSIQEYHDLQATTRRITDERLSAGSEIIRRQVKRTLNFLEFRQAATDQRVKDDLREKVNTAYAIATRLYNVYGPTTPKGDMAALVTETLRPIHFNDGQSRFFIIDYNGFNRLATDSFGGIQWESSRDMIRIAQDKGEGFYTYHDDRPVGSMRSGAEYIVYIKRFEQLHFIIGIAVNRNDAEYAMQKDALAYIRKIRYDENGYIFVLRSDGVLLSNPDKPRIGENLLNDPNARIRIAAARVIKAGMQPEGAETRYLWTKPSGGPPVPKLSYARTFAPWGWIVGTGFYLDDIDEEIAAATADYRKEIFDEFISGGLLFLGFFGCGLILYRFISGRMAAELEVLTGFFNRAAASHERIDPCKLKFIEFATIGESANRLVGDFLEIQQQLQYRIDFENLIMEISTRFINCTSDRLDEEIDRALADIGRITGMDRCYLFRFRDGDTRMDNTHEWCAEGVGPHRHRLQGLAVEDFPTVRDYILEGKDANVPDVADLPPESAEEKREFERENIRSLILIPTVISGHVTGFLGLDALKRIPAWADEIVSLLRIAGEIIAGGLERRRSEGSLWEIEQIIESTPAVVFRWKNQPGWPVELVTRNVENVFGYSVEDFLSGRIMFDAVIHPEDRKRVDREVADFSERLSEFSQEYRIIAADGNVKWVNDRTFIRKDPQGRILHYQGVVVDNNDLKALEIAHEDLQKQYEQAQKMEAVGRLSGGVAHDFNNLLTVILGYTEILIKQMEGDPQQSALQQIQEAALKARDLTNHLLLFSRKQPMQMEVADINEIVLDSLKMLGRMIGEDIELKSSITAAPLYVMADTTRVDQVLMNLAVNARDAMPDGGTLTIETAKADLDETYAEGKVNVNPGSYALIGISDTGHGIDAAIKSHIFEPFFTTKGPGKGTGLGLATCYGIVKQHGGHIFCYSEPGRGTTFKIYLPLVTDEPIGKEEPVQDNKPMSVAATVLVVEDDPAVLKLTCGILAGAGYHVMEAGHPREAIRIAEQTKDRIDLIVTDVIMPHMKGPELYTEILNHHPEASVVYMSGYTNGAISSSLGILLKEEVLLQKPFSAHGLLEKVSAVLDRCSKFHLKRP